MSKQNQIKEIKIGVTAYEFQFVAGDYRVEGASSYYSAKSAAIINHTHEPVVWFSKEDASNNLLASIVTGKATRGIGLVLR